MPKAKTTTKSKPRVKSKAAKPPELARLKPKSETPRVKGSKTMLGGKATDIIVRPHLVKSVRRADGKVVVEAVVVFGRMNPPTAGHERLLEAAATIAKEKNGVPMLYLSETVNKRNPLTYSEKLRLCEQAFAHLVTVVDERVRDPIALLQCIAEDFSKVTIITGSDGAADFNRIASKYNGRDFTFESIEVVTVDRDFDSDELDESISASALRECVIDNNIEGFREGLPSGLSEDAEKIFNAVKFGLSLQDIDETTLIDKARKAIINLRNRK